MRHLKTIHPLLFALYPLLFLFAQNKEEIFPTDILKPLFATIAVATLIYMALSVILKKIKKAGVLTSLLIILFFSYGRIKSVFPPNFNIDIFQLKIGSDKILAALWIAIIFAGIYAIGKLGKKLDKISELLALISAALVAFSLITIVPYEIKTKRLFALFGNPQNQKVNNVNFKKIKTRPDIYYLIFDRYASSTTLKQELDFDNSGFENYLKGKGFYIADKSYANYAKTFESLASSLNMAHLTFLSKKAGENTSDQTILFNMIKNYKAAKQLKSLGYVYYHIGSWWGPTRKNELADVNISWNYFGFGEFTTMLVETTPLFPIMAKKRAIDFGDENYLRVEQKLQVPFNIEKLKEMPKRPGAKFVFAHLLLPHGPYVFDAKGNTISESEAKERSERESYLGQLQFANSQIKQIVDKLLKNSKIPPVIVIQSDEGPCGIIKELSEGRGWGHCGEGQNWPSLSDKALKAKMRIFNAYYLPGIKMKNILYPNITPVNTFRIIFNEYFGADYKLLPDKSYVFTDLKHPYKFVEITDRVKY